MIDEWSDNPTSDEVLVGTRFVCGVNVVRASNGAGTQNRVCTVLHDAPTEILIESRLFNYTKDYNIRSDYMTITGIIGFSQISATTSGYRHALELLTVSHFHSFPRISIVRNDATCTVDSWIATYSELTHLFNDIANVIIIGKDEISRLNNACTMSEFYVPSIGKIQKYTGKAI